MLHLHTRRPPGTCGVPVSQHAHLPTMPQHCGAAGPLVSQGDLPAVPYSSTWPHSSRDHRHDVSRVPPPPSRDPSCGILSSRRSFRTNISPCLLGCHLLLGGSGCLRCDVLPTACRFRIHSRHDDSRTHSPRVDGFLCGVRSDQLLNIFHRTRPRANAVTFQEATWAQCRHSLEQSHMPTEIPRPGFLQALRKRKRAPMCIRV